MKKSIAVLFFLVNFSFVYAQKAVVIHDTIYTSNNAKELELYKMLYQNTKEANDANYSIMFTILGIVIAFILFILGSQAFFNYRLNRRDLDNLKSELQLLLTNELNSLKSQLQTTELKLTKDLTDNVADLTKSNVNRNQVFTKRLDIMSTSVNELMAKSRKATGSMGAALIYQISTCEAYLEAELNLSLKLALKDLFGILKDMSKISDYSHKGLNELISNIPKKYPSEFDQLLSEIISEISTKEIVELSKESE